MTEPAKKIIPYDGEGWEGAAGKAWYDRNLKTVEELDKMYLQRYGIARTTLSGWMLRDLPRDTSVLEVGAAAGLQLEAMKAVGFTDLHACDVNAEVVSMCPFPWKVGDVRALPYESNSFGLVMTSGTFMHVDFADKARAAAELARVSSRYIWGVEYQAYDPLQRVFTMIPPAYLMPLARFWRQVIPGCEIIRADTWYAEGTNRSSTYAYLIDLVPMREGFR